MSTTNIFETDSKNTRFSSIFPCNALLWDRCVYVIDFLYFQNTLVNVVVCYFYVSSSCPGDTFLCHQSPFFQVDITPFFQALWLRSE